MCWKYQSERSNSNTLLSFLFCFEESKLIHINWEFGSAPFSYAPFSSVPLADVCHVAIKGFNGSDLFRVSTLPPCELTVSLCLAIFLQWNLAAVKSCQFFELYLTVEQSRRLEIPSSCRCTFFRWCCLTTMPCRWSLICCHWLAVQSPLHHHYFLLAFFM
jgi:hypothetical protein